MSLRIGTSGWSYDHWQGLLYPDPTPVHKRLEHYLERYDTVELNYSFYRWPTDRTFTTWRKRLPDGFLMSVKASRGLTHFHRLLNPEEWLARMEKGVRLLGEKLAVLLVQLPPRFACDAGRLDAFLEKVPGGLRVAMEFRHASWHHEEVYNILQRHGAAYCVMSGPDLVCEPRATAPFVYVRFHSPPEPRYAGCYPDEQLRAWAGRLLAWDREGREVFAYFNNDWCGHALRNADTLKEMVEG